MIDDITISKVKEAAGIVDVMRDFYDLRKDGLGFTCLCPFHEDRHLGSFKISPRRNCYTCFSCGAHGGPVDFLMQHEKYSFLEAIQWLGNKYSIEVEGSDRFKGLTPATPRKPTPPLPMLELDKERFMRPTLGKENSFTRWLRELPWNEDQRKRIDIILKNYFVGTSKQGQAIFWQIDDKGVCRTGHMMLYESNGHRAKWPNGHGKGVNWIHNKLWSAHILDSEEADYCTCLYGLHLVDLAKPLTVNIVESEKTAIICSIMYGNMHSQLWMALCGASNLKKDMLQPLIDRNINIVLYPDKDATDKWKNTAKSFGYKHIIVNDSFMKMYWTEEDGEKADIADVLIRMLKPKIDKLIEQHPKIEPLAKALDLELIRIDKTDGRQEE